MTNWTLGQLGKQSQLKPIKANIMPKQTQFKAKQTQFQSQYMLLSGNQKPHFVIDFLVFHLIILRFGRFCISLSFEVSLNLCDNYRPFNLLFLLEVCF